MRARPAVSLLFLLFASSAFAQSFVTTQDVENHCAQFLELIQNEEYTAAFDLLKSKPALISAEDLDALGEQAQEQSVTIKDAYGNPIETLLVDKRLSGDFLYRLVYVVKHERHVIIWRFIFYRPHESWMLDYVTFDDSIEELF